jgi:hypothetical protein
MGPARQSDRARGEEKLGRAGKWADRGGVGLSAAFPLFPFFILFSFLSLSFLFKFIFQI